MERGHYRSMGTIFWHPRSQLPVAATANKLATNATGEVVASNMRGTDNALLAASYTEPPTALQNADAVLNKIAKGQPRIL